LFRAAGLDSGPVRVVRVRKLAINAFVRSGNRMFHGTGPIGAGHRWRPDRPGDRIDLASSALDRRRLAMVGLARTAQPMLGRVGVTARRFAATAPSQGPVRLHALHNRTTVKKESRR
jgi:hypothetical protein